jgi:indole-3-glycerol phosphate synthase
LRKPGLTFICEVKKASPSKGLIAADFDPLAIAREYEAAGANAISVLTEPEFFLGDNSYLSQIASHVPLPVLRKDFTVDVYQIYEAKILGASAVLLICALLQQDELAEFVDTAHTLGLSALVEAHSASEVQQAVAAGARIIGINNRDLQTFTVDLGTTRQLAKLVPAGCLSVSESGIKNARDIKTVQDAGVDAVLIGETLMRASDRANSLAALKGGA